MIGLRLKNQVSFFVSLIPLMVFMIGCESNFSLSFGGYIFQFLILIIIYFLLNYRKLVNIF
jgi:hypothetical protein